MDKRLIDANATIKAMWESEGCSESCGECPIENTCKIGKLTELVAAQPTVPAVVLPCEIGATVYMILFDDEYDPPRWIVPCQIHSGAGLLGFRGLRREIPALMAL